MKKSKILLVVLVATLGLFLTGCGNKNNDNQTDSGKITGIESCPNCVFAFYGEEKEYGPNGTTLTGYTKDYTTLKDENGNQRVAFLGHVLDSNGKIERGFACGIQDGKVFCIEGSNNGSTYEANKNVLTSNLDKKRCSDNEGQAEPGYTCNYDDVDGIDVFIYKNGDIDIDYIDGDCMVNADYTMICE